MMIDILYSYNQNGPGKVVSNLKKGFDLLGVEYRENPTDISESSKAIALQWHDNIPQYKPENIIIGPNICTLPTDNNFVMSQMYNKIIVPSDWVKKLYSKWIDETKICVWPVGIDTELFSDKSKEQKEFDCLIYFKRRSFDELIYIENILKCKNHSYNTLTYGGYKEDQFIDLMSKSRYGIVIGNTESQGIAIEEMMSCNLPLFVWDVTLWIDRGPELACEATSVPFWSDKCGVIEFDKEKISTSFDQFLNKLDFYSPRDYILSNLTVEKQAKQILNQL